MPLHPELRFAQGLQLCVRNAAKATARRRASRLACSQGFALDPLLRFAQGLQLCVKNASKATARRRVSWLTCGQISA